MFVKLKVNASFAFDSGLGCYAIDLTKLDFSKTGHAALVKLPREENKIIDRWLKVSGSPRCRSQSVATAQVYRPALTKSRTDPGFVFLTVDGKQRREISYCVSNLVKELVGLRVSPHSFRHMQVASPGRGWVAAQRLVRLR